MRATLFYLASTYHLGAVSGKAYPAARGADDEEAGSQVQTNACHTASIANLMTEGWNPIGNKSFVFPPMSR